MRALGQRGFRIPMMQGYGSLAGKPHGYKGNIDVFGRGCFAKSFATNRAISLLLEHDRTEVISTTDDGRELLEQDRGLAFRAAIPAGALGSKVVSALRTGGAMSIGYTPNYVEWGTVDGMKVRFIKDVDPIEIGVCATGAVNDAFGEVVEGHNRRSLLEECKPSALNNSLTATKVMRSLKSSLSEIVKFAMIEDAVRE